MKTKLILISLLATLPASAQQASAGPDPYKNGNTTEAVATAEAVAATEDVGPINLSTCYEAFSIPLATAAQLQREGLSDTELYKRLIKAVDEKSAKQEAFVVLRSRSGETATTKSIAEYIYPTEYEPAELPNTVGVSIHPRTSKEAPKTTPDSDKLAEAPSTDMFGDLATPATGSAFETQNLGLSIEVEATIGADYEIIDLRLAPQHVSCTGRNSWGQRESTLEVPDFEIQSLLSGLTVRAGNPHLIGTMNRPPNSKIDPDSAERVWFAYVTVTLQKP